MHLEPPRGLRDVAVAQLEHPLNRLPPDPVGRHRVFRRFRCAAFLGEQSTLDGIGVRGLDRMGKKKWQKAVYDVVERLKAALIADYVVLGGGNAKKLTVLPEGCRLGHNENAFIGGFRLWKEYGDSQPDVKKQ